MGNNNSNNTQTDAVASINSGLQNAGLSAFIGQYALTYFQLQTPNYFLDGKFKYGPFQSVEELVKDATLMAAGAPFKIQRVGVTIPSSGIKFELKLF